LIRGRPGAASEVRRSALLRAPAFRTIGPARQNGRILHVLVNERQPSTFYLAPASGAMAITAANRTRRDARVLCIA